MEERRRPSEELGKRKETRRRWMNKIRNLIATERGNLKKFAKKGPTKMLPRGVEQTSRPESRTTRTIRTERKNQKQGQSQGVMGGKAPRLGSVKKREIDPSRGGRTAKRGK